MLRGVVFLRHADVLEFDDRFADADLHAGFQRRFDNFFEIRSVLRFDLGAVGRTQVGHNEADRFARDFGVIIGRGIVIDLNRVAGVASQGQRVAAKFVYFTGRGAFDNAEHVDGTGRTGRAGRRRGSARRVDLFEGIIVEDRGAFGGFGDHRLIWNLAKRRNAVVAVGTAENHREFADGNNVAGEQQRRQAQSGAV